MTVYSLYTHRRDDATVATVTAPCRASRSRCAGSTRSPQEGVPTTRNPEGTVSQTVLWRLRMACVLLMDSFRRQYGAHVAQQICAIPYENTMTMREHCRKRLNIPEHHVRGVWREIQDDDQWIKDHPG